jgi:hypothetical protein
MGPSDAVFEQGQHNTCPVVNSKHIYIEAILDI